ncbi:MAG: agmatine deiminase [Eubacteriales bacterium]|nr:agmatine deiminase [Eubacteriales bacterium]
MNSLHTIPRKDGFRLWSEHDWHSGSWMLWPERQDNWRMGAKFAQKAFAEIANTIAGFEPITVCVSASQFENARNQLSENVRVIEMSSQEAFMRDVAPTFLTNGSEIRGIDWTFNGYGGLLEGLYFPWNLDDQIAMKVCELIGIRRYKVHEFVFEGCAFRYDGEGTIVVTEECLLSEGRNPSLSKEDMESTLKEYLGIDKVIWLKRGLYMDEGKGHIDNLFCFVKPGESLLSWTDDETHPQYEIVHEALEILGNEEDASGRKITIHKMPLPKPIVITREEAEGIDKNAFSISRREGDRLVGSYLNFYLPNGGLIYPVFDEETDIAAEELLKEFFPHRKLVGIDAHEVFLGGGGIHSIVSAQPGIQRGLL